MNTLKRLLTSSGKSGTSQPSPQRGLVEHLVRKGALRNTRAIRTLQKVDRSFFCPPNTPIATIYKDAPLGIGGGQTISAPHMHAIALDLLEDRLKPGAKVLDVGSGSGYLTACMALLVRPDGHVLGVEKLPELALRSMASIAACSSQLRTDTTCWQIQVGNVLDEGVLDGGPYKAIHVGAAADELHPQLLDALAPGGRLVIPVGPRWATQVLMVVDKDMDGAIDCQPLMQVGYVPLLRPMELEDGQP